MAKQPSPKQQRTHQDAGHARRAASSSAVAHRYRSLPRILKALWWVSFSCVVLVIAFQIWYPSTRTLPQAMVADQPSGYLAETDAAKRIQKLFNLTSVNATVDGKTIARPLAEYGAEPHTQVMVDSLSDYPLWQRVIPLSIVFKAPRVHSIEARFTGQVLSAACRETAAKLSHAPQNARIAIKNGQLEAIDDRPGVKVNPEQLCQSIRSTRMALGATTTLRPEARVTRAETTSADFAAVRAEAERALATTIMFSYDDQQFRPTREQLATWLVIEANADGQPALSLERDTLADYLESLNRTVGIAASPTRVTIVDGEETKRTDGTPGRQIDTGSMIQGVKAALVAPTAPAQSTLLLTTVLVAPPVVYNSRYTASEAGLRAYVRDVSQQYDVHISLRQIGGNGWTAEARADESIPSASTYKLFVAEWLFDQMAAGKLAWHTPFLDTDVSTCFNRMTIASTNACSEAWLAEIGRESMNRYVRNKGFSGGTTFTSPVAVHTTARDLTNYLYRLETGQLYGAQYRDRLYRSLGSHPFRYGVPSGSAGVVYDKVGFLWDYVHDAAVVRHPRGTYVVTIMTKGQSYARIAEITRQLERLMYP